MARYWEKLAVALVLILIALAASVGYVVGRADGIRLGYGAAMEWLMQNEAAEKTTIDL
jgi:hypothetical protein